MLHPCQRWLHLKAKTARRSYEAETSRKGAANAILSQLCRGSVLQEKTVTFRIGKIQTAHAVAWRVLDGPQTVESGFQTTNTSNSPLCILNTRDWSQIFLTSFTFPCGRRFPTTQDRRKGPRVPRSMLLRQHGTFSQYQRWGALARPLSKLSMIHAFLRLEKKAGLAGAGPGSGRWTQ